MQHWMNSGPVVVGGVGGSGTRVIAAILGDIGYYIGSDLNKALDNLWFTLLFKRPRWFHRQSNLQDEVNKGLSLFEKIMLRERGLTSGDYRFLASALWEIMRYGHDHLGSGWGMWPLKRIQTILMHGRQAVASYVGWGWKEPNTHIFLEYLARYFTDMKYVFVIRHGLDMALSKNQAQLYNWGSLFGVQQPASAQTIPALSLEYWIKANQRAIAIGKELLRERFYVVNFDQLQKSPEEEVEKLLTFLARDVHDGLRIHRLSKRIPLPEYPARYQKSDLSCFPAHYLDEVRKLGFEIETE